MTREKETKRKDRFDPMDSSHCQYFEKGIISADFENRPEHLKGSEPIRGTFLRDVLADY